MPDIFDAIESQDLAQATGAQYRKAKGQGDIFDQIVSEVPRRGPAQIPPPEPSFGEKIAQYGPVPVASKMLDLLNAPFQFASRNIIGEGIGEPARKALQEQYGLSPTASALAATALTLPAQGLIETRGPGMFLSGITNATTSAARSLGNRLARLDPIAFGRRQEAITNIQQAAEGLKPEIAATQLYEKVRQSNPEIRIGSAQKAALDVIGKTEIAASKTVNPRFAQLDKALKEVQAKRVLNPELASLRDRESSLRQEIASVSPTIQRTAVISEGRTGPAADLARDTLALRGKAPGAEHPGFQDVWQQMKNLNEKIGDAKASGDLGELRNLFKLKRGYLESLDNTIGTSAGQAYKDLRVANQAYKQELAFDQVSEILSRKIKLLEGRPEPGAQNIASAQALTEIKKFFKQDADLARALPPGALTRIETGLERIRQLPTLGAPPGAEAGSKKFWQSMALSAGVGGTLGSAIGGAMAGPSGAIAGGQAGTIGAYAIGSGIVKALSKPGGVKFVENLMRTSNGYNLSPEQFAVLNVFIRGSTEVGQ